MRVRAIFEPSDDPNAIDGAPSPGIRELFDYLAPGVEKPKIDGNHSGIAIAALNPQLAIHMAKLSRFMALDLEWCGRTDLRELAVATLNLQFKCDSGFEARLGAAQNAGVGAEKLAAIPYWETTKLFDADERLVIEYTIAVVAGQVPEDLFARVVDRFGEKGAVEFTAVVGFWSCWAMLLNAVRP